LSIQLPPEWTTGAAVTVEAHAKDGQLLGVTPASTGQGNIVFIYQMQAGSQPVSYYRIAPGTP
jgi:hypothetical protein